MDSIITDQLKDKKVGEVVYIEKYKLHFKKMEFNKFEFLAYSAEGKGFTVDLRTAKELARHCFIQVRDVKDVSHLDYRMGRPYNTKWVFQVTVSGGKDEMYFAVAIGSADVDTVNRKFTARCPEIAWKRAYIRAVLDATGITDLVAESFDYAFQGDESDPAETKQMQGSTQAGGAEGKKELKTNLQKKTIQELWDENKIPEKDRKMPKLKDEAAQLIDELTKKKQEGKF